LTGTPPPHQPRRLLIVVATDAEVPRVAASEVLVSGVGKSGAAVATAARLAKGGVDGVISFGVAGAYPRSGLTVGDVVIATEIAVLDEGVESGTTFAPFNRPGMTVPGSAWAACDASLLAVPHARGAAYRVGYGRIATVSVCAGSARLANERAATGAIAEGMEGAAVALAAAHYGLPFTELRGISNLAGPREGSRFELARALAHAAEFLPK
jgi:futalosine hydrolase